MAKMARVVVPGYPHHVTHRGNRRQRTFFCHDDYRYYIELLSIYSKEYGTDDLALLDVEMPVMDGIEAARLVRASVRYFPIAALSSDPDYRSRCLEAGMDAYITKPRSPVEMLQDIRLLATKRYGHLANPNETELQKLTATQAGYFMANPVD